VSDTHCTGILGGQLCVLGILLSASDAKSRVYRDDQGQIEGKEGECILRRWTPSALTQLLEPFSDQTELVQRGKAHCVDDTNGNEM
jgi:hypothetical protein